MDAVLAGMAAARERSDGLLAEVAAHLHERPVAERNRLIFYLGHLDAFDWNLLRVPLGLERFDAQADALFAFGIDPTDGEIPHEPASAWPAAPAVHDYVRRVRTLLDGALPERLAAAPRRAFDPDRPQLYWLAQVAIEHRLMHVETLAYMINQLATLPHPILATRDLQRITTQRPVPIPAGEVTLGMARGMQFGWDNEFPEQQLHVDGFLMDPFMTTNAMYLAFVEDGGYHTRSCWSDDGWAWRSAVGIEHPALWRHREDDWYWLTMDDERPLPPDWPVYVSHAEASAYARWAGRQLPSEAQWQRAAYGADASRIWPWGDDAADATRGNLGFQRRMPVDVDAHPRGASAYGIHGMIGNGWEWTATPFAPLPGFSAFPFYRQYSSVGFDGHHYVVKGGSAWTATRLLRRSFRNWYQPHYPPVFAGFRCVQPA